LLLVHHGRAPLALEQAQQAAPATRAADADAGPASAEAERGGRVGARAVPQKGLDGGGRGRLNGRGARVGVALVVLVAVVAGGGGGGGGRDGGGGGRGDKGCGGSGRGGEW
jgi:hypothetical protein